MRMTHQPRSARMASGEDGDLAKLAPVVDQLKTRSELHPKCLTSPWRCSGLAVNLLLSFAWGFQTPPLDVEGHKLRGRLESTQPLIGALHLTMLSVGRCKHWKQVAMFLLVPTEPQPSSDGLLVSFSNCM
eukprot:6488306-Amphidinium_carterae.2